jgi:predicted acylesterase/phospholipase RssA
MQTSPHIVFSAGISRALFASFGVLAEAADHNLSFASIGGISAGAIIPSLFAAGLPQQLIVDLLMTHGLSDYLIVKERLRHWPKLLWRAAHHRRYKRDLVQDGLWDTTPLADLIDSLVTEWPARFWTMAATGDAQIIFTEEGVFKRSLDGSIVQIDKKPARLGLALRATCALPGFFDSVVYTTSSGESYRLFDGVCSWDGFCPVNVVQSFYGAEPETIVACDVIKYKSPNRLLGGNYLGVLLPDPPFAGCRFNPPRAKKEAAIARARAASRPLFRELTRHASQEPVCT